VSKKAVSMVDRVAGAIVWSLNGALPDWPEVCARSAIEAMRTPTPKMLRAAGKAMSPEKRPTKKRVGCKAKHGIRYRAMIDAALKTSKP
jgi:hypothetical protein